MILGKPRAYALPPSPPLFSRNVRSDLYPVIKQDSAGWRVEPPIMPPTAKWLSVVFAVPIIAFGVFLTWRLRGENDSTYWLPIVASPIIAAATAGAWVWWLDQQNAESAKGPWFAFRQGSGVVELPRLGHAWALNECIRLEFVSGRWRPGEMPGEFSRLDSEFSLIREIHLIVRDKSGGEDRIFVLYSLARGKAMGAARAISAVTGLPLVEVTQADPVR